MDNPKCAWHQDDYPYESPDEVTCPECSRMIATKLCNGCGRYFIDWEYIGFDDIMAGGAATSQGDFCCTHCLPLVEQEIEESYDDWDDWYGFSGYGVADSFNLPE